MKKLSSNTHLISSIKTSDIEVLFQLFSKYYDGISYEVFERDFKQKDRVIIIRSHDGIIRGFSTLVCFKISTGKRDAHIIYSGDTIIDKDFWGTSALTIEFLKNIIKEKLKNPFGDVWWFLISKGYKTYLLMAHNFHEFYPRYDRKTPQDKLDIIQALSERFYPGHFEPASGLVLFNGEDHDKLKGFVAPITAEMCERNKHIDFFNKRNPDWALGNELACIGKVSFSLAITHPAKVIKKALKKSLKKSPKRSSGHAE